MKKLVLLLWGRENRKFLSSQCGFLLWQCFLLLKVERPVSLSYICMIVDIEK